MKDRRACEVSVERSEALEAVLGIFCGAAAHRAIFLNLNFEEDVSRCDTMPVRTEEEVSHIFVGATKVTLE